MRLDAKKSNRPARLPGPFKKNSVERIFSASVVWTSADRQLWKPGTQRTVSTEVNSPSAKENRLQNHISCGTAKKKKSEDCGSEQVNEVLCARSEGGNFRPSNVTLYAWSEVTSR